MADHALAENSSYAGFCLDEAPDERLTTASLPARIDPASNHWTSLTRSSLSRRA